MGQGLPVPAPGMVPWANMFQLPPWTGDESDRDMAVDWYLGGLSPVEATEIPYSWLSGPFRIRQDKPFTYATVTKTSGSNATSIVDADEQLDFSATLANRNDVDHHNLAHFTTTYYDEARTRLSQLFLILNDRESVDIWTILGVQIGDRVTLTDTPSTWPTGGATFVVEGITHSIGALRVVAWSTSPVIGETVGAVGPFFRVGVSALDGTDLLPW